MLDIVTMVFESTSMRYETLVARFWLRVRRVPQSSCRRQSRDKRQELWGREWHHISRKKSLTCAVEAFLGNTSSSQTTVNVLVEYRLSTRSFCPINK